MTFAAIALTILFAGWAACGFLTWLAFSVASRGNAGLLYLPLAVFAAMVFGPLVPILGMDGANGIWVSFGAAVVAPVLLLLARRFASTAFSPEQSRGAPEPTPDAQPPPAPESAPRV